MSTNETDTQLMHVWKSIELKRDVQKIRIKSNKDNKAQDHGTNEPNDSGKTESSEEK